MDWALAIVTLLVGGIGFGGVVYTMRRNAYLAVSERKHRITYEREVVQVALLEELKILRTAIERNIDSGRSNTRK